MYSSTLRTQPTESKFDIFLITGTEIRSFKSVLAVRLSSVPFMFLCQAQIDTTQPGQGLTQDGCLTSADQKLRAWFLQHHRLRQWVSLNVAVLTIQNMFGLLMYLDGVLRIMKGSEGSSIRQIWTGRCRVLQPLNRIPATLGSQS